MNISIEEMAHEAAEKITQDYLTPYQNFFGADELLKIKIGAADVISSVFARSQKRAVNADKDTGLPSVAVSKDEALKAFRNSVGFQVNFILYSGLEPKRAIDHICNALERFVAASLPEVSESVPRLACIRCGHNETNEFGYCQHPTRLSSGSDKWPCGCKCVFSAQSVATLAEIRTRRLKVGSIEMERRGAAVYLKSHVEQTVADCYPDISRKTYWTRVPLDEAANYAEFFAHAKADIDTLLSIIDSLTRSVSPAEPVQNQEGKGK